MFSDAIKNLAEELTKTITILAVASFAFIGLSLIIKILISRFFYNKKIIDNNISKISYEPTNNNNNHETQYKRTYLFSLNEKAEFWKIKSITDKLDLLLFAKVRMADIIQPTNNNYHLLNKIIRKHLDFVILSKKGNTICAIEIDDNSHNKPQQKINDTYKNFALKEAGIPIIRIKGIVPEELEKTLHSLIDNSISGCG